jgi:proline iminopeptidase
MAVIEVEGALLHVEETGSGPTALVLHGGLGLDHTMYRTLDPLGERLRLVFVDHRCNGRSTGDLETATMERWAADVAEVAGALAPGEQVIVIGHSYGGFIAQEAMISHPERIGATVLLTTTPGQLADGEEPVPEGPPIPAEFAALLARPPEDDEELAASMSQLALAYLHRAPVDVLRSAMAGTEFRAATMARGLEVLSTWSSVERLASVAMPVLVVAGRHDAFTAWPQSDRIARRLRDAEVVVLEHSGHFPWLDEPEVFFPAVTGWMERRGLLGR